MRARWYARARNVAVLQGERASDDGVDPAYVAVLPNGPLLVFDGPAAIVWKALESAREPGPDGSWRSDEGAVVALVADLVERPADEIRSDVVAFVAVLVEQGVLKDMQEPKSPR